MPLLFLKKMDPRLRGRRAIEQREEEMSVNGQDEMPPVPSSLCNTIRLNISALEAEIQEQGREIETSEKDNKEIRTKMVEIKRKTTDYTATVEQMKERNKTTQSEYGVGKDRVESDKKTSSKMIEQKYEAQKRLAIAQAESEKEKQKWNEKVASMEHRSMEYESVFLSTEWAPNFKQLADKCKRLRDEIASERQRLQKASVQISEMEETISAIEPSVAWNRTCVQFVTDMLRCDKMVAEMGEKQKKMDEKKQLKLQRNKPDGAPNGPGPSLKRNTAAQQQRLPPQQGPFTTQGRPKQSAKRPMPQGARVPAQMKKRPQQRFTDF